MKELVVRPALFLWPKKKRKFAMATDNPPIKAIIGLGNPGRQYYHHRHSIGFRIVDALAEKHGATWQSKDGMDVADIALPQGKVLLVKSHTFMNDSGSVMPALTKRGITADEVLVVHDELELPSGTIKIKKGGSHRGHNGLKSIIARIGDAFWRLRFGIGRPETKEQVLDYVLSNFDEAAEVLEEKIGEAVDLIEELLGIGE